MDDHNETDTYRVSLIKVRDPWVNAPAFDPDNDWGVPY